GAAAAQLTRRRAAPAIEPLSDRDRPRTPACAAGRGRLGTLVPMAQHTGLPRRYASPLVLGGPSATSAPAVDPAGHDPQLADPQLADPQLAEAVRRLAALLDGRRVAVLTGAGISTDSGIPDYRGPDSPPRNPMTYQQFVGDPVFRQRYWARNHIGWRSMDATRPNAGHRALAALERLGMVTGIITQNVDLLH